MPTAVACPSCQQKYNLPDKLLGKAVQCKKCGKKFQVGQPTAAAQKPAAAASSGAQQRGASAAALQKMGLDQLSASPDLFGSAPPPTHDPLANHVVHDPGFGEASTYVEQPEEEPHAYADLFANPELAAKKKKRGNVDLSKYGFEEEVVAQSPFKQPWVWFLILLGLMAAVTTIVSLSTYEYGRPFSKINFAVVAISMLAVNLWMLIAFFQSKPTAFEAVGWFFIPFYALYMMVVKWKTMKSSVLAGIVVFIFYVIAIVLLFVGGAIIIPKG